MRYTHQDQGTGSNASFMVQARRWLAAAVLWQLTILRMVTRYLVFRAGWHLFITLLFYPVIQLEREECRVFLSCDPFGAGGHGVEQGKAMHTLLPVIQTWSRLTIIHCQLCIKVDLWMLYCAFVGGFPRNPC